MTNKTKLNVKIKAVNQDFDIGLGKGILAEQEVEINQPFTEENKRFFDYRTKLVYNQLLITTFEKVVEVVEPKINDGKRTL